MSGQNDLLSPPTRSISESSSSSEEFGPNDPLMSPPGMPSSSPDLKLLSYFIQVAAICVVW